MTLAEREYYLDSLTKAIESVFTEVKVVDRTKF